MQQLDNNKIPKVGSDGEKYRDKQLIVQLPKQDLSEQYCRHLKSSGQKQGFDDFCKMRDAEAMDIGYIKDSVKENMVSSSTVLISYGNLSFTYLLCWYACVCTMHFTLTRYLYKIIIVY